MPKGYKDTKHIPHHTGAEGNLQAQGQCPPTGGSGTGQGVSKPNSNGVMTGGKSKGKQSSAQASKPPMGNKYAAPNNPY